MKVLIALVSILLLNACHEHRGKMDHLLNAEGKLIGKHIDIQKLVLDADQDQFHLKSVKYIEINPHRSLFIGRLSKAPKINYSGDFGVRLDMHWQFRKFYKRSKIEVFVDTTQLMRHPDWIKWHFDNKTNEVVWTKDSIKIASYPVVIKNYEPDTVLIGFGALLDVYLEARDRHGEWQLLQTPMSYGCSVGTYEMVLPSHHYALTSTPLYKGNFKTRFRLKLSTYKDIYSNEFTGYMNETQFGLDPSYIWSNEPKESVYWIEKYSEILGIEVP